MSSNERKQKEEKEILKKKKKKKWYSNKKQFSTAIKALKFQIAERGNENVDKTPLVFAILFEQFEIAKYLIYSCGVDVHVKNDLGQTALQFAVTHPIVHPNDTDPLMKRCKLCNLISHYKRCKRDCTYSLIFALNARETKIMDQVASRRQDIAYDRTARLSLVKMLLDAGADVNNRDYCGCTPIHCAVYTGDYELLKTLIKAGADINNQNNIGVTPLHDAVHCGDERMVRQLLKRGARINTHNFYGHTPLHWAARLDRENSPASAIIKALLNHPKVDVNKQNYRGWSAFHYVMCNFYDDSDILERFLELGADINLEDKSGATPFSLNEENLLDKTLPVMPANIEKRRIIIELVAMIEARTEKPVFEEYNLTVIDGNMETKIYYEKCRAELQTIKQWKIKDTSYTFFQVLTEPLDVIAQYARNKRLLKLTLKQFGNSDYQTVYPIYGSRLKAKLDAAAAVKW